jgi:hypothetical protein
VDGFVGHLRNKFQFRLLEGNCIYIVIVVDRVNKKA